MRLKIHFFIQLNEPKKLVKTGYNLLFHIF